MKTIEQENSIELADNRLSLFTAQNGNCAVSGEKFTKVEQIFCHHKHPKRWRGGDRYRNLILVSTDVHKLIHTYDNDEVRKLLIKTNIKDISQFEKLNELRRRAYRKAIDAETKQIISKGMTKETKTEFN